MDFIEEVRYPWNNAIEFWTGSYWLKLEATHLLLGSLFIFWLTINAIRDRTTAIEFRLATLYFALTAYTNYAFNIIGLNANEIFGVLAAIVATLKGNLRTSKKSNPLVIGLTFLFLVSSTHNLAITIIHPELVPTFSSALVKTAVNLKIIILAINLSIIGTYVSRGIGLDQLIKPIVAAGSAALLLYLLQLAIAASGTLPYGTFLDAGYVGVPSFASVSVERGHLGKFIAPYFTFFLFSFIRWNWRWCFLLFIAVSAINFSASGQVFLLCFLLTAAVVFRRTMSYKAYYYISAGLCCLLIAVIGFWPVFSSIVDKIVTIAIMGDESQGGGRSLGLFIEYISTYPFGIGYSGSTLRTAPTLPEINAAYFAFVSQFSLLSAPVLLGYVYLLFFTLRASKKHGIVGQCMIVGVIMSVVIFSVDILWFVPIVWLPFEIILSMTRRKILAIQPSTHLPLHS